MFLLPVAAHRGLMSPAVCLLSWLWAQRDCVPLRGRGACGADREHTTGAECAHGPYLPVSRNPMSECGVCIQGLSPEFESVWSFNWVQASSLLWLLPPFLAAPPPK